MLQNAKLILHGVAGICIVCANFFDGISVFIWLIWAILLPSEMGTEWKTKGMRAWWISVMIGIAMVLAIFYLKIGLLFLTVLFLGEDILLVQQNRECKKGHEDQTVDSSFLPTADDDGVGHEITRKERGADRWKFEGKSKAVMIQNTKLISHGMAGICIGCAFFFQWNGDDHTIILIIWLMLFSWSRSGPTPEEPWDRYLGIAALIAVPLIFFRAEICLLIVVTLSFLEGIFVIRKSGRMRADQDIK